MMACQLSSSQRSLAGIVVIQPQRNFSWPGDASSGNAAVARLSSGAAAACPSVTRVLRPSSSRSDGRSGPVGRGADAAARDTSTRLPAGQATGEQRSSPRVEVGLARKLGVEPLKALGSVQEQWRRSRSPCSTRTRSDPAATPPAPSAARLASRPRPRQKLERALERAGMQARLGSGERTPHRCSGSPDRTTERCRNAAAAARPPRACARPADCSSSAATGSLGPAAAVARCHARRSGSTLRSVASARARWTARRCSLVAVR